jgi:hypothetical protein
VYKSIDGGLTWQQRNNGFTNSYNTFLLVNPNNSQELFTAIAGLKSTQPILGGQFFTGGLYKSTNGGGSWTKLNTPLLADSNSVWNAVYSINPQPVIYCSWHTHDAGISSLGLAKSIDNGNSWLVINPPGVVIGNFDVFKRNGNYIIGTDNTSDHFAYASSDGGTNWIALNKRFYGEFKIHPTDSSIVFFLGGGNNINRTINGFQTTQVVYTDNSLISGQYMEDVKISESNPNIVWVCAQGYFLYKSTDGGDSFTKITAIRDSIYSVTGIDDLTNDESNDENNIVIYPNPFNSTSTVEFKLKKSDKVSLSIFNSLGQNVKTVFANKELTRGIHKYNIDFSSLPSGVYYATVRINDTIFSRKLINIR